MCHAAVFSSSCPFEGGDCCLLERKLGVEFPIGCFHSVCPNKTLSTTCKGPYYLTQSVFPASSIYNLSSYHMLQEFHIFLVL